ncbi:MAG: ribulose 1,5-bisphosphate carboxylase [Thiocapsa sp.]|uniref:RuBisCO large subunit C-terminal-like domain-containing protein n=1 Tax=Thiocapsa sp. TaxID=2024551 RepID=UPI001BCD84B0|nr:RuBisCO large subunit C-terminal-like domain-containing protein [Thiocapsa sp.]QVL46696.1 MAG: ribulose 1,5-bisphosphate carboxylase [Thiocapsa sp.]
MIAADLEGFFADADTLDPDAYLRLDYYLECRGDPRVAVAHFCSEQSTAQWRRVGSGEDLRGEFGAKVVHLAVDAILPDFSYGLKAPGEGKVHACRVRIAHPHRNFGPRIPNLLSAVCGEGTFFSPGAPVVKLLDIHFPDAYLNRFDGPRYGVEGFRDLLGVYDRPIFFGVIKPNIGLAPEAMAELGLQGWLGGLDVAKDDEMLCDTDWCSLEQRSALLGSARRRAEAQTGTAKVYLANVTDEVDRLTDLHDMAVKNGANALLVNAVPVGLSAVRMLARQTRVPLVAHFPMIAAMSRLERFGISSVVMTKLQRLAGFDVIIMPGFGGRMFMSDAEVCRNAAACLEPMGHLRPSLPVPGGSDWAGTLKRVHDALGTRDFGFVPGRGVFGHPMGPRGGAASIRQAWDAVAAGIPIEDHAIHHVELSAAIDAFGSRA